MSDKRDTKQPPAQAPQDTQPPQALIDFMMSGWKPASRRPAPKVKGLPRFLARRKALSVRFPGETLVIPTGHEKVRSNDCTYIFRPGTPFYFLTGNKEPDCVLLLVPAGKGHRAVLFVEPEVDRSTPAFFTDRARGALWVGPRLGLAGSKSRYGVEEAAGLPQLPEVLSELAKSGAPYRVLRSFSPQVDEALPSQDPEKDKQLSVALAELRLYKDAVDFAAIEEAVLSTKRALEDALLVMKTAQSERELESAFDARARAEGDGVGFATIAACGADATVLHWTRNDGKIDRKKLLLLDVGVEGHELYTADVSRTFPVSGKFSKEQREIYDLIIAAQDAAIAATKVGNDFVEPHRAASKVLAEGLERLGILKEKASESLREDRQTYKRYTLHNTSHMLGMDVHDCVGVNYRPGKLEVGMVLTIEPGLYFQENDLTVPARYRGIGIRVEEDVAVTARGPRVLTAAIPRRSKDIEAWIAKIWKSRR